MLALILPARRLGLSSLTGEKGIAKWPRSLRSSRAPSPAERVGPERSKDTRSTASRQSANLPLFPSIFPDQLAPIVLRRRRRRARAFDGALGNAWTAAIRRRANLHFKASVIANFLEDNNVKFQIGEASQPMKAADLAGSLMWVSSSPGLRELIGAATL